MVIASRWHATASRFRCQSWTGSPPNSPAQVDLLLAMAATTIRLGLPCNIVVCAGALVQAAVRKRPAACLIDELQRQCKHAVAHWSNPRRAKSGRTIAALNCGVTRTSHARPVVEHARCLMCISYDLIWQTVLAVLSRCVCRPSCTSSREGGHDENRLSLDPSRSSPKSTRENNAARSAGTALRSGIIHGLAFKTSTLLERYSRAQASLQQSLYRHPALLRP